eukprot:7948923-Heterocapsa_arctica.AAC.1
MSGNDGQTRPWSALDGPHPAPGGLSTRGSSSRQAVEAAEVELPAAAAADRTGANNVFLSQVEARVEISGRQYIFTLEDESL